MFSGGCNAWAGDVLAQKKYDTGATDTRVHARSKAFYERHLRPHFHKIGAGLYYARTGQLSFYELERAW